MLPPDRSAHPLPPFVARADAPETATLAHEEGDPGQDIASREHTDEVALRLHAFADALQLEGGEAVREALDGGDYFELLLAGFVAEYLAARHD